MDTYVIMKQRQTALHRYDPRPHEVVFNIKHARKLVGILNKKALNNFYWYKKVKNTTAV